MKKDIHPVYYREAKISCACGNTITVGSTQETIEVEICSVCHPFFTGKQRLVDTARRVEKYEEKIEKQKKAAKVRKGKKVKRAKRTETKKKKEIKIKPEKKEKK